MSRRFVNLALSLILLAGCLPLAAQTYTLQAFSFPNEPHADTYALGINNRGAVVGYTYNNYLHTLEAFKRDANDTFERPVDNSNATSITYSAATGINDQGVIVGYYGDTSHKNSSGFLLSQGVFTDYFILHGGFTQILGINNKGDFVGIFAVDQNSNYFGFISVNGVVTQPLFPHAELSLDNGIAADGTSVGFFFRKQGTSGFVRNSDGRHKVFQIPGAAFATPEGINNAAHAIVGSYFTLNKKGAYDRHGFVYDYISGMTTTVDWPDPNIAYTAVTGINSHGVIVGWVLKKHRAGVPTHAFSFIGTPQ